MRLSGVVAQRFFRRSSSSQSALAKSVLTRPVATQLTRTPFGPHSPARLRQSARSAAFEIPKAPITSEPRKPQLIEMQITYALHRADSGGHDTAALHHAQMMREPLMSAASS